MTFLSGRKILGRVEGLYYTPTISKKKNVSWLSWSDCPNFYSPWPRYGTGTYNSTRLVEVDPFLTIAKKRKRSFVIIIKNWNFKLRKWRFHYLKWNSKLNCHYPHKLFFQCKFPTVMIAYVWTVWHMFWISVVSPTSSRQKISVLPCLLHPRSLISSLPRRQLPP